MKKVLLGSFALPGFAFAQDAAPNARGSMVSTIMMIGLALVFFYFILWRPEQKRRKAGEQMRAALKKGDCVTAMGIIGTVVRIQENTVVLRMVDGAKIEMLKAAITEVKPGTDAADKGNDDEKGEQN